MIVFGFGISQVARMGTGSSRTGLGRKAPRVRRTVLVLLAFVCLFVGLAHTVSCVEQAVAATVAMDIGTVTDSSDDGPTKHSPAIGDHCHACVPGLTPASDLAAGPSEHAARLALTALLADHPWLDTPSKTPDLKTVAARGPAARRHSRFGSVLCTLSKRLCA